MSTDRMTAGLRAGLVNRRRVLGDAWVDKRWPTATSSTASSRKMITRHAWNDIWGRPALATPLMVLSMMLGIHAYEEFAMHVARRARRPARVAPDAGDIK